MSSSSASMIWRNALYHHNNRRAITAIPPALASIWQCRCQIISSTSNNTHRHFHSSCMNNQKQVSSLIQFSGNNNDDEEDDIYNEEEEEEEEEIYSSVPIEEQLKFIAQLDEEEAAVLRRNPKPWINLLGYPAKARWRVTSSFPDTLTEERGVMLQETHRTGRQIKRAFRNVIEKHQKLAAVRESERRQNAMGKRARPKKNFNGTDVVTYGPEQTFVSISHRLLPNFATTQRVLEETKSILGPTFQPKKVIDFGCGCGSASAAAINVFQNSDDDKRVEWIHGIDPSASQREAAQRILNAMKSNRSSISNDNPKPRTTSSTPRITMSESIASDSTSRSRNNTETNQGTFDLALFCYTAQEIASQATNLAAAAILWEKLSDGGVFVMVEPGTPDGFNSIRAVREMLLECCPPNGIGSATTCHVIAPCTHDGKCPMDRHLSLRKDHLKVDENSIVRAKTENSEALDDKINLNQRKGDNKYIDDPDFYSSKDEELGEWTEHELDDDDDDDDLESLDSDQIDWFENEFQTLIVEGKIFEEGGHAWMNQPITVAKSSRKGAHTENTHIFDEAFCSFPHLLPGGPRMGEKFSYIVLQKRSIKSKNIWESNDKNVFNQTNIVSLLKDSFESNGRDGVVERASDINDSFVESDADPLGLELVQGQNRKHWGKLVRAPIKKKGHIIIDFCSGDDNVGKIIRHRVGRARSERAAPGMYTAARKARWGGYWPDLSNSTKSKK